MILDVSDIFKLLRKDGGVTQAEMAEIGGVSLATQQNYEAQRTRPTTEYLQRLAVAGYDVNFLLTGKRQVQTLSQEDSELLNAWHKADLSRKMAAYNALVGKVEIPGQQGNTYIQQGDGNVQNGSIHHHEKKNI